MNNKEERKEELITELVDIRQRVTELNRSATANKLAEEELKKSEDRYRNLVELSPDMIALLNQGKYTYVNPAGIKMLGGSGPGDLIGRSVFEIIHPESLEMARERIKQLEQGKGVPLLEEKYIRFDGRIVDVEVAAAPIPFQGESMVQVIARDITERKQAEAALRKSEEEAHRLARENAVLAEIGRIISSTLTIEEVYKLFSGKVKSLIPYDRIAINLINDDGSTLIDRYVEGDSASGRNVGDVFPMAGTLTETIIQNRKGLAFDGQDENEVAAKYPGLLPEIKAGFRSFLSVPLISRDQPIGGLHFRSKTSGIYLEKDLQLAESIATQIAGAIANNLIYHERKRAEEALRKSEEEAKRLAKEVEVLAKIGRIVSSTLKIDEVYDLFAEEVSKLIPLDRISISLLKAEAGMLENAYVSGVEVADRKPGNSYPLADSIGEEILRTRKSLLVQTEDPNEVVRYSPRLLTTFQAGLRSMLSVPLISKDQAIGILHIRSFRTNAYTENEVKLAERVGYQIGGAIAIARLYSELNETKETLQKKEREFRELYDHAPLGYHEYDREGKITRVNKTDLEMLGYTAEEMIGQPMWKFNVEGESAKEQILAKLAGRLPPGNNLVRIYRRKDGSTFPVLIEDRLLKDEKGQIIGIRCTIQDITERKRAEEALRKSEEKLRELYDNAPVGYHEYDTEGRITNVNQTDLDMLGYTREEMIGQRMWKFNVDEEMVRQQIMAKLAGEMPPGRSLVRTYRRKDGTTFPVLIEDRLLRDEKGRITGIRSTIQDITERKRAEEALQQSEKELKEQAQELEKELIQRRRVEEELARSNKELGQFAYVASHDLQEPLRMVTSYVQLLARRYRGKLDGDADEFIGFAVNGAARMQQLINDLLTYSRVGTRGKEFEPTNCEVILQQSLKNLQIAIEEKQAIVSHDPLPTVMADNVQLGQLFQNLIGNAIKFQGTEPPHVHMSASRNGNGWVFSVRDNGIGIAPEYAERIFVIFQRLHTREKYPGTGIGLAVCKKIVERHGGRIWVESEPGKGATFYFTMPTKGEQ